MIVAVVGSRTFPDEGLVARFVDSLPPGWIVVSGGAVGVDTFAARAARRRGLELREFLPDDQRYAYKIARLERNKLVVATCDVLVAFVDVDASAYNGRTGGTLDAVRLAVAARKPVRCVAPGGVLPTPAELQALLR